VTDSDRHRLLHGPYTPPPLQCGDRTFCLYRDAEAVVTGWTNARIRWPKCRALSCRGGSGLLVTEELQRAVLSESAEALTYWFGVGSHAVWSWRKAFDIPRHGAGGSQRIPTWTPDELAMLGTMPDDELAAKIGRTGAAVTAKRTKLRIKTFRDRRRRG
jgi:hypothetical protein